MTKTSNMFWKSLILPATIFFLAFSIHLLHIGFEEWGKYLQSPYQESDAYMFLHKAWYCAFIDPDGGFMNRIIPFSLYVKILSSGYRFFGAYPQNPLFINAVLMSTAVSFCALTSRNIFGTREGWIAGLLGTFCGIIIFFAGITVKTNMVVCLLSVGLYLLSSYYVRCSTFKLFSIVTIFGLISVSRNNFGLAIFVLSALVLGNHIKYREIRALLVSLLTIVSALFFVTKLSSWDYGHREQKFISPVGLNFYVGNSPDSWGGYTEISNVRNNLIGHRIDALKIQGIKHKQLTRWEASRYWAGRSFNYYKNHIGAYLLLEARKVGLLFAQATQGLPEQYRAWRWKRPALIIAVIDFGIIMSFACIGIFMLRHRLFEPMIAFLLITVTFYGLTLCMFFVVERYRMPLIFLLMPFAAYALSEIIKEKKMKKVLMYTVIVITLYSISYNLNRLNKYGPGWTEDPDNFVRQVQNRLNGQLSIHDLKHQVVYEPTPEIWSRLSLVYNKMKFYPDAMIFAEKAIQLDPKSPLGYKALFKVYKRQRNKIGLKKLKPRIARYINGNKIENVMFRKLWHNINLTY